MSTFSDSPFLEYIRQTASRVRETVPILHLLAHYGYPVRDGHQQQQFPCDLHGLGQDRRPSARVYPSTNSWYCFACGASRDVIQTVREKEGLEFWPAARFLERLYGLTPLPADASWSKERLPDLVERYLNPQKTWEEEQRRATALLMSITQERSLPLDKVLRLWSAYDMIVAHVQANKAEDGWSESQGGTMLQGLRLRALEMERNHDRSPSTLLPQHQGGVDPGPLPNAPGGA